jgi:hypothetical protein
MEPPPPCPLPTSLPWRMRPLLTAHRYPLPAGVPLRRFRARSPPPSCSPCGKSPFQQFLSGRHTGTVLAYGRALCRATRYLFPRTTFSAREAWSSVAAGRGVEAAGVRGCGTTRRRHYMSEAERLSDGIPVRRRAKAEVVEPAVAAKRRVEAAGGRHAA